MSIPIDPKMVGTLFYPAPEKDASQFAFSQGHTRKLIAGIQKTDATLASKVQKLDASLTDQLKAGEDVAKVQENAKLAFSSFSNREQNLIKQVASNLQKRDATQVDADQKPTLGSIQSQPDLNPLSGVSVTSEPDLNPLSGATVSSEADMPNGQGRFMQGFNTSLIPRSLNIRA